MSSRSVIVAGGGAAGIFAAITCAETPGTAVTVLEKGPQFLAKVRISGGGRCNVTHACFDPQALMAHYPRGGRELLGPFTRFQPSDIVAWFEARGVELKTETDRRIFPTSDSSQTIIDCLLREAGRTGVRLEAHQGVTEVVRDVPNRFKLQLSNGELLVGDCLLLATGGCRVPALGQLAISLGHTLELPVPSLFTFQIETPWLRELAGISVALVEATVPGTRLCERGALLFTHLGLSGPVILRVSAWGARLLHGLNYRFLLRLNWLPHLDEAAISGQILARRRAAAARRVVNTPFGSLSGRLWDKLVVASGVPRETRWAELSRNQQQQLVRQLTRTELQVTGKNLNKEEFVTCGGIRLSEVNFQTMESRICPGLYFAGELLDIDGLTGGFNFQAAWTTGWIAGQAMARR